jgi:hypothetical protein
VPGPSLSSVLTMNTLLEWQRSQPAHETVAEIQWQRRGNACADVKATPGLCLATRVVLAVRAAFLPRTAMALGVTGWLLLPVIMETRRAFPTDAEPALARAAALIVSQLKQTR